MFTDMTLGQKVVLFVLIVIVALVLYAIFTKVKVTENPDHDGVYEGGRSLTLAQRLLKAKVKGKVVEVALNRAEQLAQGDPEVTRGAERLRLVIADFEEMKNMGKSAAAQQAAVLEKKYNSDLSNVMTLAKLMARDLKDAIPESDDHKATINKRVIVLNGLLNSPSAVHKFANKAKSIFKEAEQLLQMAKEKGQQMMQDGKALME